MKKIINLLVTSARNLLLVVTGLLFFTKLGAAPQDVDLTGPNPNVDFVYTFFMSPIPGGTTFGVVSATGNVFWEFNSIPPGSTGVTSTTFTKDGITVTIPNSSGGAVSNALTASITGAPTVLGSIFFTVTVSDENDPGSRTRNRQYQMNVIQPVSMALILDGSGSMAWGYDGNTSPPAGLRRWDGLKTGVGVMETQLGMVSLFSQDSLGLRLFSTGVIVPAAPFNGASLVSMQANSGQLSTVLATDPPGGWTALGDGILAGKDMLHPGPATYKKTMIVFSDGIQNQGDLVKEVDPDAYKVTVSNKNISDGDVIDIYTIGLGTSGSLPATMQEIANRNGGQYLNADVGADFTTFFTTQFTSIFSGRSPQIVDIRKASFPASSGEQTPATEQSFSINKGVNSLTVTLLAPNTVEARFTSIVRGTTELIQFAQQKSGSGFRTITIKYPIKGLPDSLTLDGDWKVKAQLGSRPDNATPYTLMVLADDHSVRPVYSLTTGTFKVGDPANPRVSLSHGGKAISNATVQALFVRPGDDIDDLLARSQVAFDVPAIDSASPDVAKLAVLMKDSNFVNKIKGQDQLVNLVYDAADSTYKGEFNGLTVSGVYQVYYLTSATDPKLGKIQRFQQKSFYVRFPDIDLGNSNVVISSDPKTGNDILTARFITSKGKFIGSGWKSTIAVNAAGLKIEKIEDVGDGTYHIYFNGKLIGDGIITVFNDTVYNGNLSDIGKGGGGGTGIWKHWWFWLLVILAIILIFMLAKKKKSP